MALRRRTIVALSAILLVRKMRRQRRTRSYVRPINLKRDEEGEFVTLVSPMRTRFVDDHFLYFRMTPARFEDLLRRVAPRITHPPTHRMPISAAQRLAVTLRYLACGGKLSSLAFSYRLGIETVSAIIRETSKAIMAVLTKDYLPAPTREKWIEMAKKFWIRWNFPMCVGAIDGKHFAIRKPPKSASDFYNYKTFFSVVMLAVVDAEYNFVFVDIGAYGHEGDAGIFRLSGLGQRTEAATNSYEDGGLDIPDDNFIPGTGIKIPHVIVGDQAFPLQRHIMKPYRRDTATRSESSFNYRLSRARRVSENAFGILVARWGVLDNRINVKVTTTDDMIHACVLLHNYLKKTDAVDYEQPRYVPEHFVDYEGDDGNVVAGEWRAGSDHSYSLEPMDGREPPTRANYVVREKLKNYFYSEVGRLPWQEDLVRSGRY